MKKAWPLLLVIPFLCGCSGRVISNDEAYKMLTNFETKLDQITTFSFFERKAVTITPTSRTTVLYQVFFEKNFFHSYTVNEDEEVKENNTVVEKWAFIRDGMIYDVTTEGADENPKGKIYTAETYEQSVWEARIKSAVGSVKSANKLYIYLLKNQINVRDSSEVITSRSLNESSLYQKVESKNQFNKVVRTKTYNFENSLVTEITDKDDYSTRTIKFQYRITTQEPNIPDF